jgi:hypothetical protein
MMPQNPRDPWSRLTAAAREVRDERDTTAPYGFATRVAALAMAQESRISSVFDRFALRALGVASLLALGSVAFNYNAVSMPPPASAMASVEQLELAVPTDDAVAIVLDFAD